jgi:putative protein-disulfide isomerase
MQGEQVDEREIIYVADPMCSWCWGFAPVAQKLEAHFADTAGFRLMLGGLRPGDRAEMLDDRLKATIRPHWEQVEKITHQPFNYSIFDRTDFLFDTEPASRAVVYVRRKMPEKTLPVFYALQQAFYRDNLDVTEVDNLAGVLEAEGLDPVEFAQRFDDPGLRQMTYADFTMAARLGAQGFPTVFLRNKDQVAILTVGYQSYDVLLPAVERYFG